MTDIGSSRGLGFQHQAAGDLAVAQAHQCVAGLMLRYGRDWQGFQMAGLRQLAPVPAVPSGCRRSCLAQSSARMAMTGQRDCQLSAEQAHLDQLAAFIQGAEGKTRGGSAIDQIDDRRRPGRPRRR